MQISRKVLWLILLISNGVAAAMADEKQPEPAKSMSGSTMQQDQKTQPKPRETGSATTFTPKEQIKADSSVAFPVDI